MKTLAPLRLKPSYWVDVEDQIIAMLRDLIFKPLVHTLKAIDAGAKLSLVNAAKEDPLIVALRSGRVQYTNGTFSGQFSAGITSSIRRLGGTFSERTRTFKISPDLVPNWMKAEAAAYQLKAREINAELRRRLNEIQRNIVYDINVRPIDAMPTVDAFEEGFKGAAKQLEVSPELNEASRKKLAAEYSENMKLYIQNFAVREIGSLRDAVEANAVEGYRSDKLIPTIKKRYGVSVRKAKFLARNETSIFMSKYHEERYSEAGVTHYVWSTSHDSRVRPSPGTHGSDNHRRLDGKVFAFSDPPYVDTIKMRRANPGQDYNCRCVAIPVLDDAKSARKEYQEILSHSIPSGAYGLGRMAAVMGR
jgi:SPP1 gp7 family putative phage head morphogenesis protein